jgi:hypothetical protein
MTQWRNLLTSLTLLVNVFVVLFPWPALVFAQAQVQPDHPPLYLEKEKLVLRDEGWAMTSQRAGSPADCSNCFDERLYWTNDNGRTWRNIAPPRTSTQDLTQIFFSTGLMDGLSWKITKRTNRVTAWHQHVMGAGAGKSFLS